MKDIRLKDTHLKVTPPKDTPAYSEKKHFFHQIMTLYGRKPVLEILQDKTLDIYRVHLSDSNKPQGIINDIIRLAEQREIEIQHHSKQALSRLSKNSKQDQGVCVDILCPKHQSYQDFLQGHDTSTPQRLLALDSITNPQNLGMIIRSVCAGHIDGLLIPEKGCARIDSLVVKASAGTLFKAPILHCDKLTDALQAFQAKGATVYSLSSYAKRSLKDVSSQESPYAIYVLGNETDGVSHAVSQLSDEAIFIPMNNGVESLNVAVTASLIAFKDMI